MALSDSLPVLSLPTLERLQNRQLSQISHALRTPLTSIVGFADAILNEPSMDEERRREFARIIKTEGERLSKFVEEMLPVSDNTNSQRKQISSLSTIMTSAVQAVSSSAAMRWVHCAVEIKKDDQIAENDSLFIAKVVVNILLNCIHCAVVGSPILIQAGVEDGHFELRVNGKRADHASGSDHGDLGLSRTSYLLGLRSGALRFQFTDSGTTTIVATYPLNGLAEHV